MNQLSLQFGGSQPKDKVKVYAYHKDWFKLWFFVDSDPDMSWMVACAVEEAKRLNRDNGYNGNKITHIAIKGNREVHPLKQFKQRKKRD